MSLHVTITLQGLDGATRTLERLRAGAAAAGGTRVVVGTNVRYARYQHEGTRYMTGTFYLTRGLAQVRPRIAPAVAAALPKGGHAVEDALLKLGLQVEAAAKPLVRVRTGTLRRSLHTAEVRGSGGGGLR